MQLLPTREHLGRERLVSGRGRLAPRPPAWCWSPLCAVRGRTLARMAQAGLLVVPRAGGAQGEAETQPSLAHRPSARPSGAQRDCWSQGGSRETVRVKTPGPNRGAWEKGRHGAERWGGRPNITGYIGKVFRIFFFSPEVKLLDLSCPRPLPFGDLLDLEIRFLAKPLLRGVWEKLHPRKFRTKLSPFESQVL